jgi:hypothetical protein
MVENKQPVRNRLLQIVAWFLWIIFAINLVSYIFAPFVSPSTSAEFYDWINIVIYSLLIAAIIEAGITFLIRHFAIIKPYKNGTYNPHQKFFRYLIVGILNWFIAASITLYGTILYYMSEILWPHYIFSTIGLFLILYHCPRLGPFKKEILHNQALQRTR